METILIILFLKNSNQAAGKPAGRPAFVSPSRNASTVANAMADKSDEHSKTTAGRYCEVVVEK